MLQAWVSGARANHGFVIQDYAKGNGLEWRSANENQASRRPRLTVTYGGGARMDFQNGAAPTAGYAGNADTTIASGAPPGWSVWNGWGHNLDGSGGKHESALLAFDLSAIQPGRRTETGACWFEYDAGKPWAAVGADSTGDHGGVVLGNVTASSVGTVTIPAQRRGRAARPGLGGRPTAESRLRDHQLPGGGLDPGETHEAAARRELDEELELTCEALGPCIWIREHVFPWDGRVYRQRERYFLWRVEPFELAPITTPIDVAITAHHGGRWRSCGRRGRGVCAAADRGIRGGTARGWAAG